MSEQKSRAWDIMSVLGTLSLGALIGAAVALLFAPKPGAELRQELRQKTEELSEEIADAARKAVEKARAEIERLAIKAKELSPSSDSAETPATETATNGASVEA